MHGLGHSLLNQQPSTPSVPLWTPADLNPLIRCYAPDLGLADGAPVAEFTNYGTAGVHYTQSTSSKRPYYDVDGINGKPSVNGDGVDDVMIMPSIGTQFEWWGFQIFRTPNLSATGKQVWAIVETPDGWGPDIFLQTDYTPTRLGVWSNFGGEMSPAYTTIASNTTYALLVVGTPNLFQFKLSDGGISSATTWGARNPQPLALFGKSNDTYFANFRIGEQVFFTGALTPETEANLWAYSNRVWGTPIPS